MERVQRAREKIEREKEEEEEFNMLMDLDQALIQEEGARESSN